MSRRQPIADVLADPTTPASLRDRLQTVQNITRYASENLALPNNGSYQSYADLERDAATYLVSAAPQLSLTPKRWCYLFVGCLSYRGYFDRAKAVKLAERLSAQGYETVVTPSAAYSTLGRFADPVLNSMLQQGDIALAGVLFHELAHQVIFLPGETTFNESFATAVEQLGQQQWAAATQRTLTQRDFQRDREQQFIKRVLKSREALSQVFGSDISDESKLEQKARIVHQLRQDYAQLKQQWGGYRGFDHWFSDGGPNNARLALLSTYQLQVPAFISLFHQHQRDWPSFYRAVIELGNLPQVERRQRLRQLEATP